MGKLKQVFSVLGVSAAGLIVGLHLLHAQEAAAVSTTADSIVQMTAEQDGLNLVSAVPTEGTFWIVSAEGITAPIPFLPPADQGLPTFAITNNVFLVDATAGEVDMQWLEATSTTEALEILASQVENVIALTLNPPTASAGRSMSAMGGMESGFQSLIFSTNDLWLELASASSNTANIVIHPPWNVTNGVWGLYFKTNLAVPYNWTWLLRNAPGQTNLIVTNLPVAQGFFMLGPPTAIRPGFTNNILAPNDDDCYIVNGDNGDYLTNLLASIGFPINFYGATYTNLWVNNNGNVTFDSLLSAYTPEALLDLVSLNLAYNIAPTNIIAPFWADVDTRGANSGVVTYGTNIVDGRAAFGVNWIDVGYYQAKDDKTNSFQMVLIDRSDRTNGDFDLEFNYSQIQWETGDASGGYDGLGGYSARAGFAGASGSTFELNGSGTNGAFLDTNTVTGLIYTNFNSTVPGRYVFQFHSGVPLETP